jgi:hypothetical protein
MVLTVSFVISSVIGLYCHRHRWNCFRQLDASVEASGPHDFAVRLSAVRQQHLGVHRIPPHVDDVRNAPLPGRDGGLLELIWANREAEYFCRQGWTAKDDRFARQANQVRQACVNFCRAAAKYLYFQV